MDDRVTSYEVHRLMGELIGLRNRLFPEPGSRAENATNDAIVRVHGALERERNRLIVREWEGVPSSEDPG